MRLNETGILSVHSCCESAPTPAVTQLCAQPPAGSQLCLLVCTGEREGRSGAGGSRRGRGGQSTPVRQGHGQQGEKAPGKTRGEPGALTIAQPTCAWPPPHPAPNWGCGGLELPARSRVIALAKLGRAECLVPSPSPDPASRPSFSALFLGQN